MRTKSLATKTAGGAPSVIKPKETEKGFMQAVIDLSRLYGWLVYHPFDSRHSAAGFPDLVLVKVSEPVIFAECKREDAELTMPQWEWISTLARVKGIETYIWRPSDWESIRMRLRRK